VLSEKIENGNPEQKKNTSPHAKSERRSLSEFPHDPASVEAKAGRVTSNARQVKLATGKGGLIDHRSKNE
jgi:hypothetical protein